MALNRSDSTESLMFDLDLPDGEIQPETAGQENQTPPRLTPMVAANAPETARQGNQAPPRLTPMAAAEAPGTPNIGAYVNEDFGRAYPYDPFDFGPDLNGSSPVTAYTAGYHNIARSPVASTSEVWTRAYVPSPDY
jgi:hypothetical protein